MLTAIAFPIYVFPSDVEAREPEGRAGDKLSVEGATSKEIFPHQHADL
jgi:hypothetical protein